MPYMTDARYDAFLYHRQCCKNGQNTRSIDWTNQAIAAWCEEQYGDSLCFHNIKKTDTVNTSRRRRFITESSKFTIENEMLMYNGKPVPRPREWGNILHQMHDLNGHVGGDKLQMQISAAYEYVDTQTIKDYVSECLPCKETKAANRKSRHTTPIRVYDSFQRLGIDFAVYEGTTLLVMIDYFSRFVWVEVMEQIDPEGDKKTAATGEAVAEVLIRLFMRLCRVPLELQSDNGPQFTSACLRYLMSKFDIKIKHAEPNSPTTGGRFEAAVKNMKKNMTSLLRVHNITTEFAAHLACFMYNGQPHSSLCYKGEKLCPIDVWQPDHRLRLQQRLIMLPKDLVCSNITIEKVDTPEPDFAENVFEHLVTSARSITTTATHSVMLAEGKIMEPSPAEKNIAVGDTGFIKVPKDGMHKQPMKNINVIVHEKDSKNRLIVRPVDANTKLPTNYVIKKPVHPAKFYANRKTSAPQSNWRVQRAATTDIEGYIYSTIKTDMSLLKFAGTLDNPQVQNAQDMIGKLAGRTEMDYPKCMLAAVAILLSHLKGEDSIPECVQQQVQSEITIGGSYENKCKLLGALWGQLKGTSDVLAGLTQQGHHHVQPSVSTPLHLPPPVSTSTPLVLATWLKLHEKFNRTEIEAIFKHAGEQEQQTIHVDEEGTVQ